VLARNNIDDITIVNNSLNTTFKIKDLGKLKFFLGLQIARSQDRIHICKRNYTLDIIKDIGMLGVKSTTIPM